MLAVMAATALVLAMPAAASAKKPHRSGATSKGATVLKVDLDPLNASGVDGHAILIDKGDRLRVIIRAKGLEPGMLHPQHIHGMEMSEAVCPPMSAAGDDGLLTLGDGLPFYGNILLPLDPFPVANPAGVVTYSRSFDVSGDLEDLTDETIVLHGMTVGGMYVATLPVACGNIGG